MRKKMTRPTSNGPNFSKLSNSTGLVHDFKMLTQQHFADFSAKVAPENFQTKIESGKIIIIQTDWRKFCLRVHRLEPPIQLEFCHFDLLQFEQHQLTQRY